MGTVDIVLKGLLSRKPARETAADEERHRVRPEILRQLWMGRTWKPDETFNVYIDSPFCVQQCKFCFLSPTVLRGGSGPLYQKYYDALVSELIEWSAVLRSQPIDSVYFGGGTSSLMRPDIMKSLFKTLPNLQEIPSKCFECDPTSLSKEKIDLLAKNSFSYLTFGVQTLDPDELMNQNRRNLHANALADLTAYALAHGVHVSFDIMAFLNGDLDRDMERLRSDLLIIMGRIKPTAIDLYPMSPALEGDRDAVILKVRRLRELLLEFADRFPDYALADRGFVEDSSVLFGERYRNYFLVRMDPNEYFQSIKTYSCSNVTSAPASQNTLGIGGFRARMVYSYLDEKHVVYRSNFDEVENEIHYFL